ncbi:hypothetical protein DM39_7124 [Burkholderia cenocepacia]|uniref:Carboxypeptidase regulatory-like domain-containing protein n=1 Tax=Burkholderia cenocepacia TaxID=95486 RepID=A0AAN0VK78_9BURK|nr:hypothetical protein DM39_7124 [Burkholderia cenocepacia]
MNSNRQRILAYASCIAFTIVLPGCGGADDSSPLATVPTLSGTVASGTPVANAIITVLDSAGRTAGTTADNNGAYSDLSISGMSAPLVLVATDPAGDAPLVSLASALAANGITAQGYNPLTTALPADRTGADAAPDSFLLMPANGSTLLVPTANPSQSLVLNNQTSATPPTLPAPPAEAAFIDCLQSVLQACFGSTSACTAGVAPAFLDNGFSSLNSEFPVLSAASSAGTTVNPPRTLRFYQVDGAWHADVKFDYVLPNGTKGSMLTFS